MISTQDLARMQRRRRAHDQHALAQLVYWLADADVFAAALAALELDGRYPTPFPTRRTKRYPVFESMH